MLLASISKWICLPFEAFENESVLLKSLCTCFHFIPRPSYGVWDSPEGRWRDQADEGMLKPALKWAALLAQVVTLLCVRERGADRSLSVGEALQKMYQH